MVFSGDFDKAMFAFIHDANAMAAQGMDVMMVFAFWGLNIVKKDKNQRKKGEGGHSGLRQK
jgi:peroxiredoxin family protein